MGLGTVAAFFLRSLFWLAPSLALWYFLRDYAVLPTAWLSGAIMELAFPFWVQGTELQGTAQTLVTQLRVRGPDGRSGDLMPQANVLVYCYGFPLLAALLLGSRSRRLWWKLPMGFFLLLPFQAWGVCFAWLSQVAVIAAETSRQTYFGPLEANLIAAAYQLGFLVLPPLAPVLVWMAMDRRVLAAALIEGALTADAQESH